MSLKQIYPQYKVNDGIARAALEHAFKMTEDINTAAGNLSNQGWKAVKHQFDKIVTAEFNELKEGIAAHDIHELRDGIADLLFTLIGLAHRGGIGGNTLIADFVKVVDSNIEKFDLAPNVNDTKAKYEAIGVRTTATVVASTVNGDDLYITHSASDQTGSDGRNYPAGKWLKSCLWKEPVFDPLPEDNRLVTENDYDPVAALIDLLHESKLANRIFASLIYSTAVNALGKVYYNFNSDATTIAGSFTRRFIENLTKRPNRPNLPSVEQGELVESVDLLLMAQVGIVEAIKIRDLIRKIAELFSRGKDGESYLHIWLTDIDVCFFDASVDFQMAERIGPTATRQIFAMGFISQLFDLHESWVFDKV